MFNPLQLSVELWTLYPRRRAFAVEMLPALGGRSGATVPSSKFSPEGVTRARKLAGEIRPLNMRIDAGAGAVNQQYQRELFAAGEIAAPGAEPSMVG